MKCYYSDKKREGLAQRLYDVRILKNYTQKYFAEIMKVSRSSVAKWETGSMQPTLDMIIQIARFYNVTTDYFLQV